MQLKPYHLLIQLIPGTFLLGVILLNEASREEITDMSIAFLTVVAFIFGYIFNGVAHFIEGFWREYLEERIHQTLENAEKGGWLIVCFRKFSVPAYDDALSKIRKGRLTEIPTKLYSSSSRNWSKEEKKFARTLFLVSLSSFVYLRVSDGNINGHLKNYLYVFFMSTCSVSIYRYFVSSIDYSYKHLHKEKEPDKTT